MTHDHFSGEKSMNINRLRNKMLELVDKDVINKPSMFKKVDKI